MRWSANLQAKLFAKNQIRQKNASAWVNEKNFKTDFYEKLNKDGLWFIEEILKHANPEDRILDICCNQGRFLLELRRRGFKKLYGFDIMSSAIQKLKENAGFDSKIHVRQCLAQDYFPEQKKNSFEWAITYGATIELIHPEFDIFEELSRTVTKGIIFVINENGHSYPRFYKFLLWRCGFKNMKSTTILADGTSLIVAKR